MTIVKNVIITQVLMAKMSQFVMNIKTDFILIKMIIDISKNAKILLKLQMDFAELVQMMKMIINLEHVGIINIIL